MRPAKNIDASQGELFSETGVRIESGVRPDAGMNPDSRRSDRETFSHSRISTFNNCALNYKFRYVDKLPVEDEGLEAFMGQRVHEALEYLYLGVQEGRVPELREVLDFFEQKWNEQDSEKVVPRRRGTSKDTAREQSRKQIEAYYETRHPFDEGRILLLEGRIKFYLGKNEKIPFQSIVDRLMKADDGALEIHDYKTGRRIPTQTDLDKDRQLGLYEIAVRDKFGHKGEIRLYWHYLAHGKILQSRRTARQLEDAESEILLAVREVLGAREKADFPPGPGPLCYYCSYRRACISRYQERGEHHPILSG